MNNCPGANLYFLRLFMRANQNSRARRIHEEYILVHSRAQPLPLPHTYTAECKYLQFLLSYNAVLGWERGNSNVFLKR